VSCFHILRFRTRFRRYGGRQVTFLFFACPDSFLAVPSASGPVFMFCAPELVFGGAEGDRSRLHVLRDGTHFWRYGGRQVPFSCFARLNLFSTVSRVLAPRVVSRGTEGVGSRFHVLLSLTRFQQFRGRRDPFSCFARPDSFSTVPRASSPIFMFCAPRHIFGGAECVVSHFNVLCARSHFRRYRGRPVPFSCFALPDMFSVVSSASCLIFVFCAPGLVSGDTEFVGFHFHVLFSGLIFGGTESRGSLFHILRFRNNFSTISGAMCHVFMFCAPGHVFGGTEGVGSRFYVLRAQTRFRRCRGREVPLSFFMRPDSFSAGGPEGDGSRLHVLCARTRFWRYRGVGSRFHVLRSLTRFRLFRGHRVPFLSFAPQTHFRKYRGCPVPFSCFALPDIFSVVPSASCPILMFCAPGLIFGGIEGVQSHFHVLRSQIYFRWCRVRRCATLFCALRTAAGGDGMQKKDTEIPPERAFV
jgi:hypothetical protein